MRSILALALLLCCLCGVAQARPGYICDQNGCRPAPKMIQRQAVDRPPSSPKEMPRSSRDLGSLLPERFRPFQRLRARFQAMRARLRG